MKAYVIGENRKRGCIVALPGRLGSATNLMHSYQAAELSDSLLVGIEPDEEWYPMPNGIHDQAGAVRGIRRSLRTLMGILKELGKEYGLKTAEMALVGFSAGAVMALQCVTRGDEPFAAVVSHSGAILQPGRTPPARFGTPILLMHNKQDDCFEWQERYRPMRRVLRSRGYDLHTHEKDMPGERHALTERDVSMAAMFLAPHLGYTDWRHSTQQ